MTPLEKPFVYLILGAAGSGRREIVADLIEGGLDDAEIPAVLLPQGGTAHALDTTLPRVSHWEWIDGAIHGNLPGGATRVFFVTDGARSAVDQIEMFKPWLEAQGGQLAHILCVVNVRFAAKHPPLLAWYEACIHFSDIVLLNHREGVENKWLSDFLLHFKKQYFPCVFEYVKGGRLKNPALILEPQPRRMSHYFEEEQDWIFTNADGEQLDEQEETGDGNEEIEAKPEEDPYLARNNGGRRLKELPDIAKFLNEAATARTAAPAGPVIRSV